MKLSRVHKAIIAEIANHTVNTLACEAAGGPHWRHNWDETFISRAELFRHCFRLWDADAINPQYPTDRRKFWTAKASFSRSLRTLIFDKRLVEGVALAWIIMDGRHQDLYAWQGGGKKRGELRDRPPRFKMLSLSKAGWDAAMEMLGPNIGKCEHQPQA